MILQLAKNRSVGEVLNEFNSAYPFLRLDFYKNVEGRLGSKITQRVSKTALLASTGIRNEGDIEVLETMTVRDLERTFLEQFGMHVQVARKSGSIWLETTISDKWTLKQQNDHGRELSEPLEQQPADDRAVGD